MTTNNDFCNKNEEKPNDYVKKSHNERVADTSKTIDHIADVSKKVSLKELWSKRELDGAYYIKNGNGEYEVQIFQDKRKDYRFIGSPISEFVCEVPSYEEYKVLKYRSSRFSIRHFEAENQKLKELLKECYKMLAQYHIENSEPTLGENIQLLTKIEEVLK